MIAYGVVAGLTLVLTALARAISARRGEVPTSEFPLLDFVALATIRHETTPIHEVKMAEEFPDAHATYGNGSVLEKAAGWKIGLF